MVECNFPYIRYEKGNSYRQWGESHGEEFREAIKELSAIRKDLMLSKNPKLASKLDEIARMQFEATMTYDRLLCEELQGIIDGSQSNLTDIVIINNYTDFRDIELPEEGCSTVYSYNDEHQVMGQTWDMHKSAKNFLNLIHVPEHKDGPESLILSLVGCVGIMGYNSSHCMIGVNNINTENATPAVIWPVLVRHAMRQCSLESVRNELKNTPVTSGHSYIIAGLDGGEIWEITPHTKELIHKLEKPHEGFIFHTNHCVGKETKKIEQKLAQNSTTHIREELLNKKGPSIKTFEDLRDLLGDHDNYPKSICSHYESGAQDPSFTCGGGIGDFQNEKYTFWRGCKEFDNNYKEYNFTLNNGEFERL